MVFLRLKITLRDKHDIYSKNPLNTGKCGDFSQTGQCIVAFQDKLFRFYENGINSE